jgi:hypothetical protein
MMKIELEPFIIATITPTPELLSDFKSLKPDLSDEEIYKEAQLFVQNIIDNEGRVSSYFEKGSLLLTSHVAPIWLKNWFRNDG